MKLLHVSPRLAAGSVRQMAADLAATLQARGIENALYAPAGVLTHELAAAQVKRYEWKGGGGLLATWAATRRLRRLLMRTKVDVMLAYSAPALRACVRAAGQVPPRRRPKVVAVLDSYPRHAAGRLTLSRADAAITLSAQLARSYEKRYDFLRGKGKQAIEKTAVIPYGIDERLCNTAYTPSDSWQEAWWRRHPRAIGRYTLCVPGALSPLHGQEALVSILGTLRRSSIDTHAFIVGDEQAADPAYVSRLRSQFEAAGLDADVSWVSPGKGELRDILCNCDVTLSLAQLPASHDRAVLEALALGRPVAGYDHGAVGEMLAAFLPEGRVRPGDVHALADTLTQWYAYLPELPERVPPPYRLEDTAEAVCGLCAELMPNSLPTQS